MQFTYYDDRTYQPKAALAGPFELLKTNLGVRVISYQILSGSPILSEVVTSRSTNLINVSSGKTIKFLPPIPPRGNEISVGLSMQKAGRAINDMPIAGGEEFVGPLTIKLFFKSPQIDRNRAAVYSYYFTENAVVLPEVKLLQGATGSFQISVDKSADLTNWFPVIFHNTADDQKAFYRLRLTR